MAKNADVTHNDLEQLQAVFYGLSAYGSHTL